MRVPEETGLKPKYSQTISNNIYGHPPLVLGRLSIYDSFFVLKGQDAIVLKFSEVSRVTIDGRFVIVEPVRNTRPLEFWASKKARDTMVAQFAVHGSATDAASSRSGMPFPGANRSKRIQVGVLIAAFLNFMVFVTVAMSIGGDAGNGKTEDGRYFHANHGRYTEVSHGVFLYSRLHVYSVWITHALAVIAGGSLAWSSSKAMRKRRGQQNMDS